MGDVRAGSGGGGGALHTNEATHTCPAAEQTTMTRRTLWREERMTVQVIVRKLTKDEIPESLTSRPLSSLHMYPATMSAEACTGCS